MVVLPIVQKLDYPIAIIARSADMLSLAATTLADALIRQFEARGSIILGNAVGSRKSTRALDAPSKTE